MTIKASVIIPTLNGGKLFIKVCNSLIEQNFNDHWELVIIDSGSSDNSLSEVKKIFNKASISLKIININKNSFQHGKTRNQAIKRSSGDIILLLTQDSVPVRDDWLSTMVNAFEDKNITGVFGRHIAHRNHPKLIQRDLDAHFDRMNEFPIRKIEDWIEYKKNISLRQTLHFFSNNNSGLRRTVWESIPFPEVDFGEDQTWAKKSIEAGHALSYQKKALVYHSHHFGLFEMYKRSLTEINFFKIYFNYDLKISPLKAFKKNLTDTTADIKYLFKEKTFNLNEYVYCLKKNLTSQISHTKII